MAGSTGNKILAILIVLIFIFAFLAWAFTTAGLLFSGDGNGAAALFVPGALVFGFWGLIAYQLWGCSNAMPYVNQ